MAETRLYLFEDALLDGAEGWNNSGSTATISAEGEPAVGDTGSSLRVEVDAWSQGGFSRNTTLTSEQRYLHLDIYREAGSEGQLVIRHDGGWTAVKLDASNYGLWTMEGVESAGDLSGLPAGEWAHVVIDLEALLGAGAEFQALGVFGYGGDDNVYFFDNIYFSNVAGFDSGPVNAAPVATGESYTFPEDAFVDVVAPGVLRNDTDADGDALTAVLVSTTANGELNLAADGSFTYRPNENYNGPDSFTYYVTDGQDNSETVTVSITVDPRNDAPTVASDAYTMAADTTLSVSAAEGVLANDSDVDGDALTVSLATPPPSGELTLNEDGSFDFTPEAGFSGFVNFTYRVTDTEGVFAETFVRIEVEGGNAAPVANGLTYTISEDSILRAINGGVLVNDTDPDGDPLTASLVSGPSNGTLTFNEDGTFEYRPDQNYFGADSFTYVASDGTDESAPATVTINMTPVNDAPVAALTIEDQTAADGEAFQFVVPSGAFTDVDGDALEVRATLLNYEPLPDWLSYDIATQTFSGTPGPGDGGTFTVRLQAYDPDGAIAWSSFDFTVESPTPSNEAPVAVADEFTLAEDTVLTVSAPGILSNDTDADGDPLSVSLVAMPVNGLLSWSTTGALTYTPNPDFNGVDTFTYRAFDGTDLSDPVTVTLNVTPVNDRPQPQQDKYDGTEGQAFVADVLANDIDPDGDELSVSVIQNQPAVVGQSIAVGQDSSASLNADGTLTITPGAEPGGTLFFSYQVTDGQTGWYGTILVTISPEQQTTENVFTDAFENGGAAWENVSSTVTVSEAGEPAYGGEGSSLKVDVGAWSQAGILRNTTIDADHNYLHMKVYRTADAEGQLVLRTGDSWSDLRLTEANYGQWTIDGVENAGDLSALPVGEWVHVTVNLISLLGPGGQTVQAFGVAGSWLESSTFYFDDVYFSDSVAPRAEVEPASAVAEAAAGQEATGEALEKLGDTLDFAALQSPTSASEPVSVSPGLDMAGQSALTIDQDTGSFIFPTAEVSAGSGESAPEVSSGAGGMQFGSAERLELGAEVAPEDVADAGQGLLGADALALE